MLILLLLVLAYFMWTDLTLGRHVSFTDDEQVEVLCDSEDGQKHFNTVYDDHVDLLSHEKSN